MITTRRSLLAMTGAGLTLAATGPVAAQTYPTRLIKIVAPFPAGGPTDVLARLMADELSTALGQPVMVENWPGGAGGTLGVRVVAGAEPDGYTLLLSNLDRSRSRRRSTAISTMTRSGASLRSQY